MAQQIRIVLVSDLDGGPADETVQFGLDGIIYEIDLSADEAAAVRNVLHQYISAGRKVAAAASRQRTSRSAPAAIRRDEARKIREWAKGMGFQVPRRGRISAEIVDAYQRAVA
ncbi:histone-like nucleoid-structuring protein Lsr2 [Paenarthrobacter aurescens]|jgi:S-methylmethionine-dependent homocysteine/selenocysteine methylase|uniref:Cell surface protein n=1 Tax=Paenarthrobacter aurescens (strain TC1) TaxID=290340 RepID=A1RD22_PAEAT|nr:Lsr2 family protein [Paenarthrobacter aurescens]ABM10359.1 Cell surface protein [Paenarthrobacter aurescens TC1]